MPGDIKNFFRDNEDLQFQFQHGLRWSELADLTEAGFSYPDGPKNVEEAKSFYEGAIDAVGEYVAKEVAPREAKIDRRGTWLQDGEVVFPEELTAIFDGMRDLGFFGLCVPRELGGMNAPLACYFVANELIARADVSVMTHFGFHGGIAAALMLWSAKEGTLVLDENGRFVRSRFDGAIREIAEGRNFGCMVLTEPGAGSDLGALRTKGVERDGRWHISGEKIFITSGHGQYQVVLARTEEKVRDGLDGLSLFLVPRTVERNGERVANVQIAKLEEKLGHHGSATASLLYEDSVGELIGKRGEGFKYMLALMNSARIGVGVEGIGNAEGALRMARAYAADRKSMGKPIERHELVAEKLFNMDLWIRALRALAIEAVNASEIAAKVEMRLQLAPPKDPEEFARLKAKLAKYGRRARRLTPLLKYLAGEKSVEISRDAMQVFGGMGYIDETGAHKKLRDALVLPIYEGTSQIQALMATKDHLLRTARDPAGFLRRYARARLRSRRAESELWQEVNRARVLTLGATETIMLRIFGQKVKADWQGGMRGRDPGEWGRYLAKSFLRNWDMRSDFAQGLLHAERLTRMLGDIAIAKVLVRQSERHPERRRLAELFVHRMSLRVEMTAKEIDQDDGAIFESIGAPEPDDTAETA